MLDKLTTVLTTALAVTGVGIALRPNAPTAAVVKNFWAGFAGVERAAYGPQ
jgi:hypothetical protein